MVVMIKTETRKMGKRIFYADERTETILNSVKSNGDNISNYLQWSITDYFFPVYSDELRRSAMFLWNYSQDIRVSGNPEIDQFEYERALCRVLIDGIKWLKCDHHIKFATPLYCLFNLNPLEENEEINIMGFSSTAENSAKKIRHELAKEINNFKESDCTTFTELGVAIFKNWNVLWNFSETYDFLEDMLIAHKIWKKIDVVMIITILKSFEKQFILESMGEKRASYWMCYY